MDIVATLHKGVRMLWTMETVVDEWTRLEMIKTRALDLGWSGGKFLIRMCLIRNRILIID